jgi:peptidyl-prolyl cis-trans isomerase SurA
MNMKRFSFRVTLAAAVLAIPFIAFARGTVVEEIIARVNNDIITLSDYQKAEAALPDEVQQDCQGCPPDKINAMLAEEKKNLLRSLIDKSLLVQRAQDMSIDVTTDVVRQLDQIRQQNKLPSLEALEKAVESQGMGWEDYKQEITDSLLTQRVIQEEVGSTIKISNEEIKKYYDAHKSEFVKPEEVDISEILFNTQGKSPEEMTAIMKKAQDVLNRLKLGEDFGALAQRFSDGSTASQGGELGVFKSGELTPQLEKTIFALHKGDITGLIHSDTGMEIFRVNQHYDAGQQPLDKVEMDIENIIYQQRIPAAMRVYLTKLRRDSYVVVKPGYVDTGAAGGSSVIQEVSASGQDKGKKKKSPEQEQ